MSHGTKSSIVVLHPFGKWKIVVFFMTLSTSAACVMRSSLVNDDVSGGDVTDVPLLFTSIVVSVEVPGSGSLKKKKTTKKNMVMMMMTTMTMTITKKKALIRGQRRKEAEEEEEKVG